VKKKKSLTELRVYVEKEARRKKYYEKETKIKEHQIKHLTRVERTHRLCSHGGMLEKFIERPDIFIDEQIMELLTFVFHKDDVPAISTHESRKQKNDFSHLVINTALSSLGPADKIKTISYFYNTSNKIKIKFKNSEFRNN